MTQVIVFDVNETLLDLAALDEPFERLFGDPKVRGEWFGQVLQSALVVTIVDRYQDFAAIGGAALEVVGARRGVAIGEADRSEVAAIMRSLPPHPDAAPSLTRLSDAGFRLAALTNSPPAAAREQLTSAGLAPFFERILSVDPTGKFKPAAEPYRRAAGELNAAAAEMTMVAAHDWDVAGAMHAGYRGVLVTRPGVTVNPLYPPPDIVAVDLADAADRIVAGS